MAHTPFVGDCPHGCGRTLARHEGRIVCTDADCPDPEAVYSVMLVVDPASAGGTTVVACLRGDAAREHLSGVSVEDGA